jgi:hypothetical protein
MIVPFLPISAQAKGEIGLFAFMSTEVGTSYKATSTINLRCPACRHEGAFPPLHGGIDEGWTITSAHRHDKAVLGGYYAGYRKCPNADCGCLVFFVDTPEGSVFYPPQVIDFDASNLPPRLLSSLEEAVKCHAAGCYRASALMVRRTLEELCEDKGATGNNLKQRISALQGTVVISTDLLEAADELRLLGNDAAHIEAQTYDAIETEEIEVAIDLTKELLKAVYQHTSLVARMRALKRPATP